MIGSTLVTGYVPLGAHGGRFTTGQPRVIVLHSIECPLEKGRATSVAQSMAKAGLVSVHYLVDPAATVQGLDETLIGWGAGTVNSAAIHIEQSGYAAYTRAQWTTTDGLAQLKRVGALVADIGRRRSIPLRWLTDAQLKAAWQGAGPGGLTTHDQCRRVIGGTTHTDPGANYPKDLLLQYAAPKPAVAPTVQEDDLPYTEAQLRAIIRSEVKDLLENEEIVTYPDQRLRPAETLNLSIVGGIERTAAYASNASGGVDQIARKDGLEPEDRK